jgi:hypothetical protein
MSPAFVISIITLLPKERNKVRVRHKVGGLSTEKELKRLQFNHGVGNSIRSWLRDCPIQDRSIHHGHQQTDYPSTAKTEKIHIQRLTQKGSHCPKAQEVSEGMGDPLHV